MATARESGCRRFIYASSASVYGVNASPIVDENQACRPITDYAKYKMAGESILFGLPGDPDFETIAVRAATVCGWSPRQRLDLTVNMLTASALARGVITVFGGAQYRPNIHIDDLVRLYHRLILQRSLGSLNGRAVNVGGNNLSVAEIAAQVKSAVEAYFGIRIPVDTIETEDNRSYRLSSTLVERTLGFRCVYSIHDAILQICDRWDAGFFSGSVDIMTDPLYHNVRNMQARNWQIIAT
jgi:nucleoside-diphosphate-sugar epimerase